MVYQVCRGLVARGHQVDLYASGDSRTPAGLHAVVDRATLLDEDATFYLDKEYEARNTWNLFRRAADFSQLHLQRFVGDSNSDIDFGVSPLPTFGAKTGCR